MELSIIPSNENIFEKHPSNENINWQDYNDGFNIMEFLVNKFIFKIMMYRIVKSQRLMWQYLKKPTKIQRF